MRSDPPPRSTPPRRGRTRIARGTGLLLAVLLAFAAGTAWRLAGDGIAVPRWAVARVEDRLGAELDGGTVSVGAAAIGFDAAAGAIRLLLRDAALGREGREVVRLPRAALGLAAGPLLRGRVRPTTLRVAGLAADAERGRDGRWSFGLGGGGAPPGWAASLAALDRTLALPVLGRLRLVEADGIEVRVADAATGLAQRLEGGTLRLRRDGPALRLAIGAALPVPGGAARLEGTVTRDARGAAAELTLGEVPIGALAEALPRVRALSLATGRIAARASFALGSGGRPGPLRGTVALRDARLADRPRVRADRVALGFAWVPGESRVALTEISLGAPDALVEADGQLLFEAGLAGPVVAQLRLRRAALDPAGVFDRRVLFDDGVVEARLTQSPLALRLGQAVLAGPSGTARAEGRVRFDADGLRGAVDFAVPRMAVGDLAALWPRALAPGARRWFTENLPAGIAEDVAAALRVAPGAAPEVAGTLRFTDGRVRYMRFLPPAEDAAGALSFERGRLAIRVDRATVAARGPEGVPPGAGMIDIGGTTVVLPDALARPPDAEVRLRARGTVPDVLTVLDNEPFRLLARIGRTRALAEGRMEARVEAALPLRRGNAPADVRWEVDGTLRDVASDRIVPGRTIRADALRLRASPQAVSLEGEALFDGVPFRGSWRQPLPPPATAVRAPDDPAPPVPVPPARLEGRATVTPEGLAALGVAFDALTLSGTAEAEVEADLPPGGPATLRASSDLRGMSAALGAIGWRKARGTAAPFAVEMRFADPPAIEALSLDAPGLSLRGAGRLRPGGGLDRLRLAPLDAGWFRGAATIRGAAPGALPTIVVEGGTADLRRAPDLGGGGGGGGSGGGAPLALRLDRLQVSDGIALTAVRADLRGGRGSFSGLANGRSAVTGAIAPRGGGTAVTVRSADAGGLLRALDLYRTARGGRLEMTLQPAGGRGTYDGSVRGTGITVTQAPALATLLQAISEGRGGGGLRIDRFGADFRLAPDRLSLRRAAAVGPGLTITGRGTVDLAGDRVAVDGVVSPFRAPEGPLFSEPVEGTFGVTYRLRGAAKDPAVEVDALSILAPGALRGLFR